MIEDVSVEHRWRDALNREKELQRLVAAIATRFISVDPTTLDATIEKTLAELGTFCGVDRAVLFRRSHTGDAGSCTHEWRREGIPPKQSLMQNIPISVAPWYARTIVENREVVHIPSVSDLPPEAAAERKGMKNAGVLSAILVPIYTETTVYGFLDFEHIQHPYRWSDTEIQDLRVIAQILGATLERLETESVLERSESLLNETERIAETGSWDAQLNTNPVVVHWSAETYRILEVDPAATDPSFDAFLSVVHPEDRKAVWNAYRRAVESYRTFEFRCRLRPKSGQTKHARVTGVTKYTAGGDPARLVGVVQDMTHITELKQELVERTEAIEFSITATAIAEPGGALTYVNQAFLDMWGAAGRDEVIGMHLFQFHPDESKARNVFDTLIADGNWDGEMQAQRADGEAFTALVTASAVRSGDGAVRSLIASFTDITRRKEIELQARSHAEKFRALVNSTMEGYWVIDGEGRLIEVNDVACQMLGYTRNEMLGLSILEVEAVENPAETAEHIRRLMETGYDRFVTQHIRNDGSVIDVEVSANYYTTADEAVIFAFIQDITDRKRAEAAETAREVAERSNRTKSRFLANITHELRTPLNAIMGFTQILQMNQDLTVAQSDSVREILNAGDSLLSLINGILDLSQIETEELTLNVERVDCLSAINDSIASVAALAEESDISIDLLVDSRELYVRADHGRLRQVFVNLLSNAVQYNRPGGDVNVRIAATSEVIRVTVTDTGYGIPVEQQADLFTSFDRVGREAGNIPGTGIGLVYSKRLIEMMGGSIGFESAPGRGSAFWVEIPSATLE